MFTSFGISHDWNLFIQSESCFGAPALYSIPELDPHTKNMHLSTEMLCGHIISFFVMLTKGRDEPRSREVLLRKHDVYFCVFQTDSCLFFSCLPRKPSAYSRNFPWKWAHSRSRKRPWPSCWPCCGNVADRCTRWRTR